MLLACLAVAAMTAAAQTQPVKPADSSFPVVRELLSAGQYQKAESLLRDHIAGDKRSAQAHYLLGYVLLRENRSKDSLAEYTLAATLQQPSAGDLKNVALDYVLLNDLSDAKKWLERSVSEDKNDPDAWYALGRVHYEQGGFLKAIDCFERALALAPKSVKIENNLGLAYEGLNRRADAVAAYQTAIGWQQDAVRPSEQPLLNLAIAWIYEGKFDEALPLLSKAVTIAPRDPRTHEQLGQLYLHTHQLALAQSEFEQAVALSPDKASLHFLLGQAYHRQGLEQKAKEQFDLSSALSGTHSVADRN